ncbi:MAG TPA: hypothetical protein VIO94_00385 [Phenylobacterium sp.]
MSKPVLLSWAAGLASVALLTSPVQAQTVSAVDLVALPTQVRINIVGKDYTAVRQDVRHAAGFVCRNARTRGELNPADVSWCAGKAATKTMKRYRKALANGEVQTAGMGQIVLSAR